MKDRAEVLIIDDDPKARSTLSDILRLKGYRVLTAGSGAEALAQSGGSPDVVLLDLRLPDIPGIEVLKRVKAASPSTEVIILTGHATLGSAIEAANTGAFSYLQKPYEVEELLLHVRNALEKKRAAEELTAQNAVLRKINHELSALCKVSAAISRSIDLKELLDNVLETVTGLEALRIEQKGAVFTVEGGRMRLITVKGHDDSFGEAHKGMKVGECLCGLVAETAETMVAENSLDDRHTIRYQGMRPHGHIIVPLKAADRVVGVLCLYTGAGGEVDEQTVGILESIGNQLGVAVSNSMLYEKAKSRALHDPLTGLANRRFMLIELDRNMARAKRYGNQFSIMMMDLDNFKRYNDSFGHVEGDRLLVDLARTVVRETREADLFARYGGEEFMLLLPDTGLWDAVNVAERMREKVKEATGLTVSIGVASYSEEMKTAEELIKEADRALYKAKLKGRDRVEVCS